MNPMSLKRVLVLGALSVAWMCGGVCSVSGLTFAVLGDRTGGAVEGVFEQVVADVGFLDPDLILTVGDHIEGYLADSAEIEAEWDYIVGLLDETGIVYHLTPGNHDIWDAQSRRIYARRFGSPDTAFVHEGNLFVVLDVSTDYKADGLPVEKIQWLEGVLMDSGEYANTFVFYHKPFWCEDFSFERVNLLHEVFRHYGVDAVFTGHYHRHFYTEQDGIRYFGVSSSGGSLPPGGREKGCFYSYLLAKVEGEDLEIRVLEPGFGGDPDVVMMDDIVRIAAMEADAIEIDGVEVEGSSLEGTAKVKISVSNPGSSTLRDTARWVALGDWIIEPASNYVEVPPGETGTITAYLSNEGDLFPVPRFEMSMALDGDDILEVSKYLPVRRVLQAPFCDQSPEIDGSLRDGTWHGVEPESRFFGSAAGKAPADSTSLRVCHDGEHLYVATECYESSPESLRSQAEIRDGFAGYDDYVLVLLEPEPGSNVFYQIAVNPKGTVFDKHIEICPFGTYVQDYAWDAEVDVATGIYEDRWVAELRIPLEPLGLPARDNGSWGFNFRRWHQRIGAVSDFQVPLWYATDRLGRLVFR